MLRGSSTETHIREKFIEMIQPCFEIKVTELVKYAKISHWTMCPIVSIK
jgi:hypothetical protein